jgi:Condensation domain
MKLNTIQGETTAPVTYGQLSVLRSLAVLGLTGQAAANLTNLWKLPAGLTTLQVREAWRQLVAAHESLRTTYEWHNIAPTQTVHPVPPCVLENVEVEEASPAVVQRIAAAAAADTFDIKKELPWRAVVVTHRSVPCYFIAIIHHVAADNAALTILKRYFMSLLHERSLPPSVQPRDLARAEQADRRRSDAIVEHWVAAWPGFLAEDRRPDDVSERRRAEIYSLDALTAVRKIASRLGISVQSAVLAAGALALGRLTGRAEFTFSLMAANRLEPQWAPLISSLNQCAPLTVRIDERAATDSFLKRNYFQCLDSYMHGMYDVDALQERLKDKGGEPDPTFFAKHFNYLGEIDEEPTADARMRSCVNMRFSNQRSGPNLHLVAAVGRGLYIGVGASSDLLPGNQPAIVAAGIEAALINMGKADEMPLGTVSTDPVRDVFPAQ